MALFPRHTKFQSALLEEIMDSFGWASFASPSLSEADKSAAVAGVLRGSTSRHITEATAAKSFKASVENLVAPITRLTKHCSRSKQQGLTEYIRGVNDLVRMFYAAPTKRGYDLLERHSAHAAHLMNEVVAGRQVDRLAKEIIAITPLQETSKALVETLVEHDRFIHTLEQKLKVVVEKWEPVDRGLFVYVDRHSTAIMESALNESRLWEVADSMGYLLLRHGSKTDLDYGPFGESTSCWLFVYAPVLTS